ncbi:hypothetical protein ACFY4C_41415 [Actinomadura viridis]|uniref:hypothetical protein n=1 Tax=Actinomadura viridis TaxID=58110 RepID=UPI0036A1C386
MSNPKIRVVKVRLADTGNDDAGAVAKLLTRLLPELSRGRCQAGEISPAYPNRRGSGARRYFDLYLLDPSTAGSDGSSLGPNPQIPRP